MTRSYDPLRDPAACVICKADAEPTTTPRPSGYGFQVVCPNGHVTNGMPRADHPALNRRPA